MSISVNGSEYWYDVKIGDVSSMVNVIPNITTYVFTQTKRIKQSYFVATSLQINEGPESLIRDKIGTFSGSSINNDGTEQGSTVSDLQSYSNLYSSYFLTETRTISLYVSSSNNTNAMLAYYGDCLTMDFDFKEVAYYWRGTQTVKEIYGKAFYFVNSYLTIDVANQTHVRTN